MSIDKYPNPWSFGNKDKQLQAVGGNLSIVYGELGELAMGAPLGGPVYLKTKRGKRLIDPWSGGPPVWETKGQKVAIPKWTNTFWQGTRQQFLTFDTSKMELTIYKKKFHVLDIRLFDGHIIYACDSPIHNPKIIEFNLEKEKVEHRISYL